MIKGLSETVKSLAYQSAEYEAVLEVVSNIFGDDFSLTNRDILVAKGDVSLSYFIFFTAAYYQPQSFCCRTPIYLKLEAIPSHSQDLYNRHRKVSLDEDLHLITFICSSCKKTALKLKQQKK